MIAKISWTILFIALVSVTTVAQDLARKAAPKVEFISTEELKSKFERNERLMILDVRSSESYANSDKRIKGAIHVKVRRLEDRLRFPPLKDVPRNLEVITYCSCPAEEASIAAAKIMLDNGFTRVRALKGGWQEWLKINGAVETRP